MAETKCGFCNSTKFELVEHPELNLKYTRIFQCENGHPVGIVYDSESQQTALRAIAKDVKSLPH